MDLQAISSQMKVVIQKHQIVVSEMRNDPQNPVLQKRLNDLKAEIQSLNERQKQVVQDLRKNLEQCSSPTNNSVAGFAPSPPPSPHLDTRVSQKFLPLQNHTHAALPPNCVNRHSVPPHLHAPAFAFKAPVGAAVVLPPGGLLSPRAATADHPKALLVVPSPSNRAAAAAADGQQQQVLLNLGPPIRVPQYPPPRMPCCPKNQVVNHCTPVVPSPPPPSPESSSEPSRTSPPPDKKKLDFLSALGLVSREALSDIRNKRLERKRRSTANPQFSNAALEEKLRNAPPPHKRPRGRPPRSLDSRTTNGASGRQSGSPAEGSSPSTSHSPFRDSPTLLNGSSHKQQPDGEEGKNVEQMLSGLCLVCTQPGDLVKCGSCAKQQHPSCMQPPPPARPGPGWRCAECRRASALIVVTQSYDVLKAAKEDEKRKLLKKSLELRLKRSQLEGRLSQLRELSGKQKSRQSELRGSAGGVEGLLERIRSVISGVRLCS